jgi:hypothetical protein
MYPNQSLKIVTVVSADNITKTILVYFTLHLACPESNPQKQDCLISLL